jgi:hypothetical protein
MDAVVPQDISGIRKLKRSVALNADWGFLALLMSPDMVGDGAEEDDGQSEEDEALDTNPRE